MTEAGLRAPRSSCLVNNASALSAARAVDPRALGPGLRGLRHGVRRRGRGLPRRWAAAQPSPAASAPVRSPGLR